MKLDLNIISEKLTQNEFIKNFMKELSTELQNYSNKNEVNLKEKNVNNIELTDDEEIEFERRKFEFFQDYFEKQLSDLSKGEIYIVTDKYENDNEYHRYKVTQYKDNLECKYITFEENLPKNVKLGDIVRKINGSYIYDEKETQYVNNFINKIKQDIINSY